ncbi:MAG: MFS transporter [Ilumatobacteraceae bacterium]
MTVDHTARQRSGFSSSLRNGGLRKLYGAETVSGAGDGVFWVALVVLLGEEPRFALWLTLAVVARLAPRAVLSLPAGSLVDRSNVRSMLVAIEFSRALLMVAMSLLAARNGPASIVLVIVVASYTIAAPIRPALSAVVPAIAGERHLAGANALLSTVRQIMTFVGPLMGAAIAAVWSPAVGFAVNAATLALSGLLIGSVRGLPDHSASADGATSRSMPRLGLIRGFVDGIGAVRSTAALPALVLLIGVMYFVRGAEMVLHVYVVRDRLDAPVDVIGLLAGAIGFGAVLAMPVAARAADSRSPVRPVLFALVATAVPTAALAIITRTVWACVVLVGVGVGMVVFEVVIVVMVQRVTEPTSLGRVFGAINGAANTGKLVGAVAAPALIALFGLDASLVAVAAVVLLVGSLAVRPLVVFGRVAAARQSDLAPRVAVLQALEIFEGASRSSLERLAAVVDEVRFPSGKVVIHEGAEPDDLYIVIRGSLVATVGGRPVGEIGRNGWFGEIGLLDRRPRTATVTTVDDATLWRISGETFLDVLEDAGAPPSALVDGIADRLAAHR